MPYKRPETYKIVRGVYDKEATPDLPCHEYTGSRTRGHQYKFKQLRRRTRFRQYLFYTEDNRYMWNSLPNAVVEAPSVEVFERRLDKYWDEEHIMVYCLMNKKATYVLFGVH